MAVAMPPPAPRWGKPLAKAKVQNEPGLATEVGVAVILVHK